MELNYLESIGLLVSMTTLYLGLWTFSDTAAAEGTTGSFIVTILIFIVNCVWVLCVLSVLLVAFRNKVTKVWMIVQEWSMKCFQCLQRRRERKGDREDAIDQQVPSSIHDTIISIPPTPLVMTPSNSHEEEVYKVNPLHQGEILKISSSKKLLKNEVWNSNIMFVHCPVHSMNTFLHNLCILITRWHLR
jgi:hypothetical protein